MHATRVESGQIMPIVALLMVVIIGLAAFGIDGSNIYSQHRRLQADLDVAVKVAAAKMFNFNPSSGTVYTSTAQTAIQAAAPILATDGYPNSIGTNVYPSATITATGQGPGLCGISNTTSIYIKICTPPIDGPFKGRFDYAEGFLGADVRGYFGGVLGLDRVHISVRAVAWHGGAYEPFAIIGLDNDPTHCGIDVQNTAANLTTLGSIHSNGQTCVKNGTAHINGTAESVAATTMQHGQTITGTAGTTISGANVIANPYAPTVPLPAANAITICASGCTATSFIDPNLPSWAQGSNQSSCYGLLAQIDLNLQITPPSGVTYYLPPDNPPAGQPGTTAQVDGLKLSMGQEVDFFPHCNTADPTTQSAAIYLLVNSRGPYDVQSSGGATINSFNSALVFQPTNASTSTLYKQTGTSGDKFYLNAAINGPLHGVAIYENQPCDSSIYPASFPQSMDLSGSANSLINGIVDVACANVTVSGNSTNNPFINGVLVGWDVTLAGNSTAIVNYNPTGSPPDKGSVLVE